MFTVPPSIEMAPPPGLFPFAVFSMKELSTMVRIPPPVCPIAPPPKVLAVLAVKLERVIVTVPPLFKRAPPPPARLSKKLTLVRFRVTPKPLLIAPPLTPVSLALAKVRLEISTEPLLVLSICTALLPLTVRLATPGPFRLRLSLIVGSVVARVIVPVMPVRSIISAPGVAFAWVIASRSDPKPESLVLVTAKVAKTRS